MTYFTSCSILAEVLFTFIFFLSAGWLCPAINAETVEVSE